MLFQHWFLPNLNLCPIYSNHDLSQSPYFSFFEASDPHTPIEDMLYAEEKETLFYSSVLSSSMKCVVHLEPFILTLMAFFQFFFSQFHLAFQSEHNVFNSSTKNQIYAEHHFLEIDP
jgi:hypothetical protein